MTVRFGLPAELAELADEYEFLGELGRGGSAVVYRARDRALGRDVAIKVVHPRPTSPDDDPVARLAREARTAAQLHHHGIVTVYAVRRLHAGGLTLVMQLVPGLTLKATIQRDGPFSPERAESILRDVAGALAYADGRQIVHRDVKPENIFLDDTTGRALLADFGIARSAAADSLTMTGTAIGTPFYMSPEQVDGLAVDGRSDLYSLGLVAWEMLTGLRPWDGESLYHVIYKQKHDELPPIEAIRRDVPRRMQYIVERMLQKQPAARWAGADGLLAQLDRTILPSDYGQWQAALPGRIARHRAVVGLQRPGDAKPIDRAALSAATVQFAAITHPSTWTAPSTVEHGRGPSYSEPIAPVVRDDTTDVADAHQRLDGEIDLAAGAIDGGDSMNDGAAAQVPVYDTIAPTWAHIDPDTPRISTRAKLRRVRSGSVIIAGVAVGVGALLHARQLPAGLGSMPLQDGASFGSSARRFASSVRWTEREVSTTPFAGSLVSDGDGERDLIAVGARHQCSITLGKSVQCWGDNGVGQFGDGSEVSTSRLPRAAAGIMTYAAIAAGASHTCGVTEPGDVYCWGENDRGQLGDGTVVQRSAPVRVGGTGTYKSVRAGAQHTCALDVEGQVRCWGDNSHGQLGDGTRIMQPAPVLARLPRGGQAIAIAVGGQHSCALLADERVACWGANVNGQLGAPNDSSRTAPTIVGEVRARAIAAGDAHTCAALVSGPIRCWGRDDAGQLGSGAVADSAPGRITTLQSGEGVRALTAGSAHSCALTEGGWVWCWGRSSRGAQRAPGLIGGGPYVALSAGGEHTCGLLRGHVATCWTSAEVWPTPGMRVRAGARHLVSGSSH